MSSNNNIPSEKFCILPWIHLHTYPSGKVVPCCLGNPEDEVGHLRDSTIAEIINDAPMRQMRSDMLENKSPMMCNRCYDKEQYGIESMRLSMNKHFSDEVYRVVENTNTDGRISNFKALYWDFRFSNVCNMKCRTCGPEFSSLWYDDSVKMYGPESMNHISPNGKRIVNISDVSKQNIHEMLDEHIDDVKLIYFAGGEPLITDEHYFILNRLIELGRIDIELRYNTNILKLNYKDNDLISLWSKFDNVNVMLSLDSYGSRAEYIRYGTKWNDIQNNVRILALHDNINLTAGITTSIFNVLTLTELFDELLELGIPFYGIYTHNVLQQPIHYHAGILRVEEKQKVEERYMQYIDKQENQVHKEHFQKLLAPVIKHVNILHGDLQQNINNFKNTTDRLDEIRGERFISVFPELADFYQSIGE